MTETPLLRIITPDATPEEIAALVAVFASLQTAAPPTRKPRSAWASPDRAHRLPLRAGSSSWRLSGRS